MEYNTLRWLQEIEVVVELLHAVPVYSRLHVTDNISVFYELLIENFTLGVIMCLLHGDVLCKINTITLTVTVSYQYLF